ncbi:MAG: Asp-tRNA(Asn)/Glu-tRNA(Gln) amidotransferase subunit GatC [Candidatus Brocadiaceae bacterium]|nr:Asp-tRNA(Asn)/Glu-tRNA(Gln) amidotransferase subunit GatC [Candidatus Brocadiaceae bacterium]
MAITREQVEHVALLARLDLTDGEKTAFAEQLSAILDYVAKLDELDTGGVEPLVHGIAVPAPFRPDQAGASLSPEEALQNAPERMDGFFRVPRIIE